MKKGNEWIIALAILVFLAVLSFPKGIFILYGGQEIEGEVTDIKGECWTLATSDKCVRQTVNLINFTKQNLLVCPEIYYPTEINCKKAFGLIKEEKPKINCYYIKEDECKTELFELPSCPTQYYSSMDECKTALETYPFHIKKLFTNPSTWILLGVILIVVVILIIGKKR